MDSDLGNSETSYFNLDEPVEQKKERKDEKAKVQGGRALLEEMIERWEEKVMFYDSVDSIPSEVRGDAQKFMLTVNVNALTKQNLLGELNYLEALRDQYL
jgi:hypothetical protein